MPLTQSMAKSIGDYLAEYVSAYRVEWGRFTGKPPAGAGYPALRISPYLDPGQIDCFVATDGALVAFLDREPADGWYIAGGPAFMLDTVPSSVPHEIKALRDSFVAETGDPAIGIYNLGRADRADVETLRGVLPEAIVRYHSSYDDVAIEVHETNCDLSSLLARFTLGAFGPGLDVHLPDSTAGFWNPLVVRNMGFIAADPQFRRFVHYLEVTPHIDAAAWDPRSIWSRAHVDVRRDFARAFAENDPDAGSLTVAAPGPLASLTDRFVDRLRRLDESIEALAELLEQEANGVEAAFQDFLERHPVLLDVYGKIEARPKFHYPNGEGVLSKSYVEPDFLVRYPGNQYRLIEIERPNKRFGTKQGQAAADLSQAVFQTAEWKTYIQEHCDQLRDRYPGISSSCSTTVIMSRATARQMGGIRDPDALRAVYKNQFAVDEILFYDDLLRRAREASARLAAHALGPAA